MKSRSWPQTSVVTVDGTIKSAIAPLIISASRSTDIPALYGDWFFQQLRNGYTIWTNPFNGTSQLISFEQTRIIVFWSKNPVPFLPYLTALDKMGIRYFFQYTLNDYENECFEPGIPSLTQRIADFNALSSSIGKEKVLWRFDPIVITASLTSGHILERIEYIGNHIAQSTERLTISFLSHYPSVIKRMARYGIQPYERTEEIAVKIGTGIAELGKKWGLPITTCAEKVDMSIYGISPGSCIDPLYIMKTFHDEPMVVAYIVNSHENDHAAYPHMLRKKLKDPGQRPLCNCMRSKDIGRYGTCKLGCLYCYAGGTNGGPEKH